MKDTINRKLILLLGAAVTALICLMLVLDLTLAGTVKPMDNSLKGKHSAKQIKEAANEIR